MKWNKLIFVGQFSAQVMADQTEPSSAWAFYLGKDENSLNLDSS